MLRPIGALVFGKNRSLSPCWLLLTLFLNPVGALADRYGRRWPLMIDIVLFSIINMASGFAPNLQTFIGLRAVFGICMGGEWVRRDGVWTTKKREIVGIWCIALYRDLAQVWRWNLSQSKPVVFSQGFSKKAMHVVTCWPPWSTMRSRAEAGPGGSSFGWVRRLLFWQSWFGSGSLNLKPSKKPKRRARCWIGRSGKKVTWRSKSTGCDWSTWWSLPPSSTFSLMALRICTQPFWWTSSDTLKRKRQWQVWSTTLVRLSAASCLGICRTTSAAVLWWWSVLSVLEPLLHCGLLDPPLRRCSLGRLWCSSLCKADGALCRLIWMKSLRLGSVVCYLVLPISSEIW